MISEIELSYLAGFFDGEGTVNISRPKSSRMPHTLYVSIANTDLEVIKKLPSIFGGSTYMKKRVESHHRPLMVWSAPALSGQGFLKAVLPYLKIKKRQAEIAIEFQGTKVCHSGQLTQEIIKRRDGMVDELRKLNRSGRNGVAI